MTYATTFKAAAAALVLAAPLAAGPARAEAGFAALEGIAAEPMSAADMEAVQGKAFFLDQNGYAYWYGLGDILNQAPTNYLRYDSSGLYINPGIDGTLPTYFSYFVDQTYGYILVNNSYRKMFDFYGREWNF